MRLWTLHPKYLDPRGLVALWREALLAQKVLRGLTIGYTHHPQLIRFRAHARPVAAIASYLACVEEEARRRGYRFDASKIDPDRASEQIVETAGQLSYEWKHLQAKLKVRHPEQLAQLNLTSSPDPHPLFDVVPGAVRNWEHINAQPSP